ncbi:AAEL006427-PA [Aedes aegypti]|uniref:AAEL006427-PA n=1 Tax=Aedes aegypti TaxID=7159 RepID=Q0IF78_AEDAE|nr:AAEL006427-PA [Aedes aegypti]
MTLSISSLLCTIVLFNCCDWASPGTYEIIFEGYDDNIENVPYIVSLSKIGCGHFCGGTLISSEWLLTAAHCLVGETPDDLYVRAGSTYKNKGGMIRKVRRIIPHRRYSKEINLDFDIGLVQLKRPLPASDFINWIPLVLNDTTQPDDECIIAGWGTTKQKEAQHQTLKTAVVKIISKTESQRVLYMKVITKSMPCTGAQKPDACQGDSGGPMICAGKLSGVVSLEGCEASAKPGVYISVFELRKWIAYKLYRYFKTELKTIDYKQ